MKHTTTHTENISALRRAGGQISGIQRMIEEGRYCIDIIIQLHAAIHALYGIEEKIFAKHLEHCVKDAFTSRSKKETAKKTDEILKVIKNLHKLH